jgi:predicted DsbA family dithiol-disulfide isomerase
VWRDYVCPVRYLKEPLLERLEVEYGDAEKIQWHGFELRPDSDPGPTIDPNGEYHHTTGRTRCIPWRRSAA